MSWMMVLSAGALATVAFVRVRRSRDRKRDAGSLASTLVPEIRTLLDSCDPSGHRDGEPCEARVYGVNQQRLVRTLPKDAFFAVETFYQCVESYRGARSAMIEAFDEDSELSLGDKIRAKDRRDRCLKDVYYTGEAAIQNLEGLST